MESEKTELSNGVLRSGISAEAAKLCLKKPILPFLPYEGVTQWWGQPFVWLQKTYEGASVRPQDN